MIKFLCCAECSVHGYINSYLVMLLQGIFISMSCSHWDKVFFLHQTINLLVKQSFYLIHIRPRRIIYYHYVTLRRSLAMV